MSDWDKLFEHLDGIEHPCEAVTLENPIEHYDGSCTVELTPCGKTATGQADDEHWYCEEHFHTVKTYAKVYPSSSSDPEDQKWTIGIDWGESEEQTKTVISDGVGYYSYDFYEDPLDEDDPF